LHSFGIESGLKQAQHYDHELSASRGYIQSHEEAMLIAGQSIPARIVFTTRERATAAEA